MAFGTLAELREHLSLTPDIGDADDALLERLLAAARNLVERQLGFKVEAAVTDGAAGFEEGVPPALVEAVLQLAAHWYEAREAAGEVALHEIPFGVAEIVTEFRRWTF